MSGNFIFVGIWDKNFDSKHQGETFPQLQVAALFFHKHHVIILIVTYSFIKLNCINL